MDLKDLKKAATVKPVDFEKQSLEVEGMVSYIHEKTKLGIFNLEDGGDLFTEERFAMIKKRFGISKEDAILLTNYNAEVFGKIKEVVSKVIKGIIDFILKLFGKGNDRPANKEKAINELDITDDLDTKSDDIAKTLIMTYVFFNKNVSDKNIKKGITILLEELTKIIDGKKSNRVKTNITGELLKLVKSDVVEEPEKYKEYTLREYEYILGGWRVEHGKMLVTVLALTYVNNGLVNVTPIKKEIPLNLVINKKTLKKALMFHIIDKIEEKAINGLNDKLKALNKKIDDLDEDSLIDYYEKEFTITDGIDPDITLRACSRTSMELSKLLAIKEKYSKKALELMKKLEKNKPNTESDPTPEDMLVVAETEEEKDIIASMFNMEADDYLPASYKTSWGYIKKLAWINVKTAPNTQLKARLLSEQISGKKVPLRLNKELAKLHFMWVLNKDYGITLSDVYTDYNNVLNAMTSFLGGDVKQYINSLHNNKLIAMLETQDMKKISKFDPKTKTYNGKPAQLKACFVNFNVNIENAKHGRLIYTPNITIMVQVVDSSSHAVLKNTFINKKLRQLTVTKNTLPMVVDKVLLLLKNDMFTTKKLAGFLKNIANVEKGVNSINSIANSPIMVSYTKLQQDISEGAVKSIIASDVTAIMGMTKNVIEYDRLKTYFLNEVARKTMNQ